MSVRTENRPEASPFTTAALASKPPYTAATNSSDTEETIVGYMAVMYWFPDLEWGFVALQNTWSFVLDAVQFKLMDEFLDSVGAPGKAFDLKSERRKLVKETEEKIGNGRKTAYPDAPDLAQVASVLPLTAYEWTYNHPAYGSLMLKIHSPSKPSEEGLRSTPQPLVGRGTEEAFENQIWHFDHVSGENWWLHLQIGPGFALVDDVLMAKFEVNAKGSVAC